LILQEKMSSQQLLLKNHPQPVAGAGGLTLTLLQSEKKLGRIAVFHLDQFKAT